MKPDIEKLIKRSKPDTKFDKRFAKELRMQLLGIAPNQMTDGGILYQIINQFKSMTNVYKYAGAIAVVVIVVAAGIYSMQSGGIKLAFAPEVTKVGSGGFGSLLAQDGKGESAQNESGGSSASTLSYDKAVSLIAQTTTGIGRGGGGFAEGMIAPMPVEYEYRYIGDKFELNDAMAAVLRRVKGAASGAEIISQIKKMDFAVVDLSSFSQAKMQNINFSEDKDFGYNVDINFNENMISIYENWERWENPFTKCTDEKCYEENRLTIDDVPSDEELIAIAQKFFSEYKISTDVYGSPEIVDDWRRMHESSGDKTNAWIPDQIQVRYPMFIKEEAVYDQGGNPIGMTVNVNIRHKRPAGLWGLRENKFESSDYEAITDVEKVIAYAEAGGMTGMIYYEVDGMTSAALEVELGTPERVFIQIYNYSNGQSNELFVPALRFPVVSKKDDKTYFWRNSIIVPLAKELIQDRIKPEPRPLPEPAPLPVDGAIIKEGDDIRTIDE